MRSRLAFFAAIGVAMLASARPAAADCEMAGPIDEELAQAQIAFVGVVTHTAGSNATFRVEESWKGDLPAQMQVNGLAEGGFVAEDDRTWTVGQRYLVLPMTWEGMVIDHICTATTEWRPELADLRPADARILAAEASEPPGSPPWFVPLVLGITGIALAAAFLVGRRRTG
jgi:hypothetical protein